MKSHLSSIVLSAIVIINIQCADPKDPSSDTSDGYYERIRALYPYANPYTNPYLASNTTQFLRVAGMHYRESGKPKGNYIIWREHWMPINNDTTVDDIVTYFKHLTKAERAWLSSDTADRLSTDRSKKIVEQDAKLEIKSTRGNTRPFSYNVIMIPSYDMYGPCIEPKNFKQAKQDGTYVQVTCAYKKHHSFFKNVMKRQIDPRSTKKFERW